MTSPRIVSLHCYPIKSAHGWSLEEAQLCSTGLRHDREWMIVSNDGRFVTQREAPQLALLEVAMHDGTMQLQVAGRHRLEIPLRDAQPGCRVQIWKDNCAAFDCGSAVATWLSEWLGFSARLVRFDERQPRLSPAAWTGEVIAANHFTDGFPLLVIGVASLADLNARMERALPMERFRPNIVLEGLEPYAEDQIDELRAPGIVLKLVKPCSRCSITTTDQHTGARDTEEPLRTLRNFRYDRQLHGVVFGQNAIIVSGVGETLRSGQRLEVMFK